MSEAASPIDETRRRDFERRWLQHGDARIEEFLPHRSDVRFDATLLELVCIDMEMRYRNGDPPSVSDYVDRFALAEDSREHLSRERDYLARRHVAGGGRIGRYVLAEVLGRGAFAEVWRARDPDLGRDVAVKRPRAELGEDPEARARFRREAESVARLRHPAIVTVHEVGEDRSGPFLVCDLIPGPTLAAAMRERAFAPRDAAAIVARLADALDYAHQFGIVHRDVKPGNILLDEEGRPLLTDFGLAHLASARVRLTRHGEVLGTPAYMAPEQVLGDEAIDGRSDVFSLGVVLYELLCGRSPFPGESAAAISYAVVHGAVTPPRRVRPSVPADLETVCLKAMAREADRRYASAGDFADDLRRFLARRPVEARRRGPVARLALWARRKPALALSLAAIVVVGGAAFSRILQERAQARANLYRALVREAEAQLARPRGAGLDAVWRSVAEAARVDTDVRDDLELRILALRYLTSQGPHFRERAAWTGARDVSAVTLSPDGSRLFECGPGGTRVRDPGTGAVLASDPAPARALALDDAGQRVAVAAGRTVRLLDAATLRRIAAIECAGDIEAVALGARLLACGGSSGVETWEMAASVPGRLRSWPHAVHCLALSGERLAAGGADGVLRLLDVGRDGVVWTCSFPNPVRAVSWGHMHLAAVVWENLRATLVDLATGRKREPQGGHDAAVRAAFFDPQGTLVTASADGALAAWDKELARIAETRVGGTPIETAAAAGTHIVTLDARGRRTLWEIVRPRGRASWYSQHAAVFVPGTRRLFAGTHALDLEDGEPRVVPGPPPDAQTWGAAADPQGRRVARTSHSGRIVLCDARTLGIEHELQRAGAMAWCVAFDPEGIVVAAGTGNEIALWDTATGGERGRLRGHEKMVAALAFHPGGRVLASASRDGTLRLWDRTSQRETARLLEGVVVHGLHYAGETLLAACGDGTLRVWRPGVSPRTVAVGDDAVWAVTTGPGGVVATGSQAGLVRLFDPVSWRTLAVLPDVRRVRALSFDDSGRYLAASVYLGDGAVWDLPWLDGELDRLGLGWR